MGSNVFLDSPLPSPPLSKYIIYQNSSFENEKHCMNKQHTRKEIPKLTIEKRTNVRYNKTKSINKGLVHVERQRWR